MPHVIARNLFIWLVGLTCILLIGANRPLHADEPAPADLDAILKDIATFKALFAGTDCPTITQRLNAYNPDDLQTLHVKLKRIPEPRPEALAQAMAEMDASLQTTIQVCMAHEPFSSALKRLLMATLPQPTP